MPWLHGVGETIRFHGKQSEKDLRRKNRAEGNNEKLLDAANISGTDTTLGRPEAEGLSL